MRQIAKLPGMPSFRTLLRWTKRYPGFGQTLRECLWLGKDDTAQAVVFCDLYQEINVPSIDAEYYWRHYCPK